jgi:hypothetical protein
VGAGRGGRRNSKFSPNCCPTQPCSYLQTFEFHHPTNNFCHSFKVSIPLYSAACYRSSWASHEFTMLCEYCCTIDFYGNPGPEGLERMMYHETIQKLFQSAVDGCELCRKIWSMREDKGKNIHDYESQYSYVAYRFLADTFSTSGSELIFESQGGFSSRLSVYADEGTVAQPIIRSKGTP